MPANVFNSVLDRYGFLLGSNKSSSCACVTPDVVRLSATKFCITVFLAPLNKSTISVLNVLPALKATALAATNADEAKSPVCKYAAAPAPNTLLPVLSVTISLTTDPAAAVNAVAASPVLKKLVPARVTAAAAVSIALVS